MIATGVGRLRPTSPSNRRRSNTGEFHPMPGDKGRWEQPADEFLPYLGHIKPNVVALDDGSLMAMVWSPGLPFELDGNDTRNARPHRMNSLTQMIGDDNVTIHVNFVRGDVEPK